MTRLFSIALAAIAASSYASPAAAETDTSPADASDGARKEDARRHFDLGVEHFDREEWSAALAEFLESRTLYPTKGNTKNAAICLRKVGRFDEALDLFEALLRDFTDLSPADRALAQREIEELHASVGTAEVRDAPPGAAVTVDGVSRGRTPLPGPIRLAAGSHLVRVDLEGTVPFEQRIDLTGGQAAVIHAALVPLAAHREVITIVRPAPAVEYAHFVLEIDAGVPLGVVWGGDVTGGCAGTCARSLPVGASGQIAMTYQTPSGFGVGLQGGYVFVDESVRGRADSLQVVGYAPEAGTSNDTLRLGGLLAGAHAQYVTRSAWPVLFRLAAGVVVGSATDARTGTFADGSTVNVAGHAGASYLYVGPEIGIGRRLGEHFAVRAGVALLLLSALSTPEWQTPVVVTSRGEGTLATAKLTGGFMIDGAPEIGVQYEF